MWAAEDSESGSIKDFSNKMMRNHTGSWSMTQSSQNLYQKYCTAHLSSLENFHTETADIRSLISLLGLHRSLVIVFAAAWQGKS